MFNLLRVTILVTSVFLSLASEARPRISAAAAAKVVVAPMPPPEPVKPWGLTLKVQGTQTSQPDSKLNSYLGLNAEYRFLKTYQINLEASHSGMAKELRNNTYEGVGDVGLSVANRELWVNRDYRLELKGTLGALLPSGYWSKTASMQYGAFQNLALKKSFTDAFSVTYFTGMIQYSWNYETAYEDADITIYNIQYQFVNRLSFNYDVRKYFHWTGGASVLTYHTTGDEDFSALILSNGFSYDVNSVASLDFGVRSGYKRKEDPIIWNGPTTSKKFLGSEGILIYVGTTFKI